MKERNCADCDHCLIKLRTPLKTNRELAESTVSIFDNSRAVKISCALRFWSRDFGSVAVFEASDLPKTAAENCSFYAPEQD